MPDVVRSKLTLDPVFRSRVFLGRHNPSIVDEDIDFLRQAFDLFCSFADRAIVEQIEFDVCCLNRRVYLLDLVDDWGNLVFRTTGKDDLGGLCRGED